MGNKPVNYVSWYDSIRFANWLHNGQGPGDTETGAYTLLGGTADAQQRPEHHPQCGRHVVPAQRGRVVQGGLPSAGRTGGDATTTGCMRRGATALPTVATADAWATSAIRESMWPTTNVGADWNSQDGNVTTVGSAGPLSDSFYGTSDQGGNVWEWNEFLNDGDWRVLRGGSFLGANNLLSWTRIDNDPSVEFVHFGFRVATDWRVNATHQFC